MDVMIPQEVLRREDLAPSDKLVYGLIATCGPVVIAVRDIASELGIGTRTVFRALYWLRAQELIEIQSGHLLGAGQLSRYRIRRQTVPQ